MRKRVGRLDREHAHPGVAPAHVELRALAGVVAQRGHDRRGRGDEVVADQTGPEHEPPVGVAGDEPVRLKRDREPMGRRAREPGRGRELTESERARSERVEHGDRLVEHADAAYSSFHYSGTLSQIVRWLQP